MLLMSPRCQFWALPYRQVAGLFLVLIVFAVLPALASGSAAADLVIDRSDLPVSFAAGGVQPTANGQVALFLRPEVLAEAKLPAGDLLGVMAAVEVTGSSEEAGRRFAESDDAASISQSIGGGLSASSLSGVRRLTPTLEGVDGALLFRVEYELAGVAVVEYRYRLWVGKAVANLLINGRPGTDGGEPAQLMEQARQVAERQAERLTQAALR